MRLRLLLLVGLALAAVASADQSKDDLRDHHHHDDDGNHHDNDDANEECPDPTNPCIVNQNRACPDGFFYAGEPSSLPSEHKEERWQIWEQGPSSPVYSCYAILSKGQPWSLSGASLGCNDLRGQLISINQFMEQDILTGQQFTDKLKEQVNDYANFTFLTSGLTFDNQNWTWFGADEPINGEIMGHWNNTNSTNSTFGLREAQCLAISWKNGTLMYSPVPCGGSFSQAICEVRAYTQTWYVWFSVNWLQVLFFFTLVSLIVASCCLFQTWFSRPDRRQGRVVQGQMHVAPPPYTLHQQYAPPQSRARAAAANYAQKGRDILAKVTFYKPAEDKQPLA